MRNIVRVALAIVIVATTALAQEVKLPNLERLNSIATEVVDVNIDRQMLGFATKFMSEKDADERQAKKLITNLRGIFVRSYEFDKDNQYTQADVEPVREQMRKLNWMRMVEVRSRKSGENVDLYFKPGANGAMDGMVVVVTEPRELTLVYIDGPLDPDELGELGGQFGIPKVDIEKKPAPTPKGGTKK